MMKLTRILFLLLVAAAVFLPFGGRASGTRSVHFSLFLPRAL